MKSGQTILAAALTTLIVFGGLKLAGIGGAGTTLVSDQPAFDRVTKTRTIRCAYATWAPYITVDPNTKKLSGFAYDIFEQVGKILNMKVEWTEEIPWSQVADNLKTGRNDVMCNTVWPSGNRALPLDFTMAIDYIPAYAFVRADDTRFDGNLTAINDPGVTVAVIDGDFSQAIPSEDYPSAKQLSLSMDSDGAQLLLAVTTKKADVTFVDPFMAFEFAKHNPGTIKQVANAQAVRVFGDSYAVDKGETKLRDTINLALEQLNQSGFIRQTLDKYLGEHKGMYFYPAQPYEK
ncbi:MAG: transporter substrate-binding domain-containing protein [Alphaproteobacteria bacterium]|nr:transporter substrate-binding domain-containing protein [Alphaproteobacteria bacterium]